MTEKRPGPAPGVPLIEAFVKRELTVLLYKLHQCFDINFFFMVAFALENKVCMSQ